MDRAFPRDRADPLLVLLAELGAERDRHIEPRWIVVGRLGVLDCDLDRAKAPLLAFGIHLDGDRGTGSERRGEQLARSGPLIRTSPVLRLVHDQAVLAEHHLVLVAALPPADDDPFHRRPSLPSKICGFSSSAKRARAKARSEARLRYR